MQRELRATGLPVVPGLPWGAHCCLLYRFSQDLADAAVSFFRAGLEGGERCVWVATDPEAARSALRRALHDVGGIERRGQLKILDAAALYSDGGEIGLEALLKHWFEQERRALEAGFTGLRVAGETSWLERRSWQSFLEYEAAVQAAFHGHRILALCSYSLERCSADDVLKVANYHDAVLVRDAGRWGSIRNLRLVPSSLEGTPGTIRFFDDAQAGDGMRILHVDEEASRHAAAGADPERRRLAALEALAHALPDARSGDEIADAAAPIGEAVGAVRVSIEPEVEHEKPVAAVPSPEWMIGRAEIERRYPGIAPDAESLGAFPLPGGTKRRRLLVAFGRRRQPDAGERGFLQSAAVLIGFAFERTELRESLRRERSSKLELVATLSHELRNPLASISAVNEALKILEDRSQGGRWQNALDRQIEHLARLLDAMLDFSRLERGKVELPKERLDVRAVLCDALEDKRAEIERRGLELDVKLGDPAASICVIGDRMSLTQIFHNLVSNSIRFTPAPGKIAVTCDRGRAGEAIVTISDTGSGIEAGLLPHVFEPFTQSSRRGARDGLGLGLALVRRLVSEHGGRVFAESPGPGRGTTFTIVLPAAE